ncbi:hypothetical protein TSH100_05150 [Azospirillum sp. TSH100]|nr:hypothetical protein TSH100_05150 [Azospirillum sp. TSH100]
MVVVTLNYRLGALGFLTSWDLLANKPVIAGNFGIQDQQNALKWVQKYISSFGGDPTNVTLSGESAGAMSAGLHTFSIPSSTDYFNQTIMESNPLGITYLSPEGAYNDHGSVFLGNLCNVWMDRVIAAGATNPQCLLELKDPSKWKADGPSNITSVQTVDIMNAQGKNNSNCGITNLPACAAALSKINLTWSPVVDGATILGQPISGYQNGSKDKTILMGTNKNEGNLFVGITTSKVPLLGAALSGSDANTVYGLFLDAMFGLNNKISSKSSYNPSNYSEITGQIPNSNPQKNFSISPQEQALSQVVTDYVFNCPNYQLLSNISKSTKSAYTYQFVQAPFFDAYVPNDNYFCMPAAGAVCHGNELPYVFNTLNVMKGTPNTGDPALATFMNSVWAGFVNSSIPAKFSPYSTTASAPVVQLANTSSSPVNAANLNVTNVAAGANCSLF